MRGNDVGDGSGTGMGRRRFIRLGGAAVAGATTVGLNGAQAFAALPTDGGDELAEVGVPKSVGLTVPKHREGVGTTFAPDPIEDGTPRLSSRANRAPAGASFPDKGAEPVPVDVPTSAPFDFEMAGYRPQDVPERLRPWRNSIAKKVDTGPHDADGVRMFPLDGKLLDHPVGQIQFGLQNIAAWRRATSSADRVFFLARARAQADRLIEKRMLARGAWYFPYPFAYSIANHSGIDYEANWVSGMAQGESLSLFSQLCEILTGPDDRATYRTAADAAFASLLKAPNPDAPGDPWVVMSQVGYLWIQEYPQANVQKSDFTYNGFLFAILGLWDYYQLTRDKLVADLFDGSLTTIATAFSSIRNKGWYSSYCVTHRPPHVNYHKIHIELLLQMHWLSGKANLAHLSDTLVNDAPPARIDNGAVVFGKGTHTFHRFSSTGAITSTKKLKLTRASQANTSLRTRIRNRGGVYYLISNGAAKGWCVQESYPKVFLRGQWLTSEYAPHRTATFPARRAITAYKYGTNGAAGHTRTVTFTRASNAPFDARAVVNGRIMVRISAGFLTNYWVQANQITANTT